MFNVDITGELVAFFVFAAIIIGGSVLMISLEKVVHMVISMAAAFLGLAGMYVLLEAEFVAFVQVSGETFEKRDLAVGIRDAGWVQVMYGVKEGERVVTKGAYAIRLASVSTTLPSHGHSH